MSESVCDWSEVARSWDANRDAIEKTSRALTEVLLARLTLAPGERVLELGCGNGELAPRLRALVEPGGSLLTSDVAPEMVEVARKFTAGTPGIDVRQIDATAIDLEDASFDAVVFRMGLMLIPDPNVALEETRRVLRAGGRLGAAVWGAPAANPWLTSVGMAAMMHGLVQGGPPVGPGGPLSLHDPVDLEKRARNAGFSDVSVEVVDFVRPYESSDKHFDMVTALAPPIAAAMRRATPEQSAAVRQTVADLVSQYRNGDALELPGQALVLVAS